mmetsp:Transcript_20227/g.23404  ORF Transcript_20227/g.23404 Transcript_20227/m.23404 type:complete len:94 (-) Transcript_20227:307-588(-)
MRSSRKFDYHEDHHHQHDHKSGDHDCHEHHHSYNHNHSHAHGHDHGHLGSSNTNINVRAALIHIIGDIIQAIGVLIAAVFVCMFPSWQIIDPI